MTVSVPTPPVWISPWPCGERMTLPFRRTIGFKCQNICFRYPGIKNE